jgi:prevent-host-death family protein
MWLQCSHIEVQAMTRTIGIRELKNETSAIVHAVREESVEYVVTYHGKPVAVIRPFVAEDAETLRQAEAEEEILELQRLGQQIAAAWVSPKSAVDLVDEQRR